MKVMYPILAAIVAVTTLAAPAAAQDSSTARRARAQAVQKAQAQRQARVQAQQQKAQAQRQARAQAQRQKADAQRLARQRALRQRQEAERERQRKGLQQRRDLINSWPEVTEPFFRTVRLGRNGTFDLQNVAGNIIVTGGAGDEVRIDATKRVRHRVAETARAMLPEVRIDVIERGGNVEVRTAQPHRSDVVSVVEYSVAVPRGAGVVLRTVSGDVQVTNINGELRAQSGSGNLTATSVRRLRDVRSVSGTLDVSDSESDEFTAHTISGDVLVRNLKGRALDLETVTGNIRLTGVEMDRARLQSTGGGIDYHGRLARSGRYEFQSHSGSIRITPSGNPGFDLEANALNGAVRSDYALKPSGANPPSPQWLRGTVGDASAAITAHSLTSS